MTPDHIYVHLCNDYTSKSVTNHPMHPLTSRQVLLQDGGLDGQHRPRDVPVAKHAEPAQLLGGGLRGDALLAGGCRPLQCVSANARRSLALNLGICIQRQQQKGGGNIRACAYGVVTSARRMSNPVFWSWNLIDGRVHIL